MRHQVKGYRLGRSGGHRTAMKKTMMRQLLENGKMETTITKAKFIQADVESLITIARNADADDPVAQLNARRLVKKKLGNNTDLVIRKLFDEIGPRFKERNGGYTRLLKLGPRLGDGSEMALLELVEK